MFGRLVPKKLRRIFAPDPAPLRSPAEQALVDAQCEGLSLYEMQFCPYCVKVRMQIKSLQLNIALRSVDEARWGNELVSQGGKFQTPCLRIEDAQGQVQWLYESDDIITWLRQRFALSA